jgi:hypothetical protein
MLLEIGTFKQTQLLNLIYSNLISFMNAGQARSLHRQDANAKNHL